jgi:hypothetical protein
MWNCINGTSWYMENKLGLSVHFSLIKGNDYSVRIHKHTGTYRFQSSQEGMDLVTKWFKEQLQECLDSL